jgi:hypothetical protein
VGEGRTRHDEKGGGEDGFEHGVTP